MCQSDKADADGVLIATLRGANGKPLAERLVFRQPKETVNVQLSFDFSSYMPGSPAKLTVRTTGADGNMWTTVQ